MTYPTRGGHGMVFCQYGISTVWYLKYHTENTIPYQYSMVFIFPVWYFVKNHFSKYYTVHVQYGIRKVQFGIFLNTLDKIPYRTGTVWYFFKNDENHENTILKSTVWYFIFSYMKGYY